MVDIKKNLEVQFTFNAILAYNKGNNHFNDERKIKSGK